MVLGTTEGGTIMVEVDRRRAVLIVGWSAVALGAMSALSVDRAGTGRGRGVWTTFGSVAVLAHRRGVETGVVSGHGHDGGTASRTVSRVHRIDVEVHNGTARPLLFSPGQFRLRLASDGPSMTPFDAGMAPAALAAGSTVQTWVSYLLPPEADDDAAVEFTEAGPSRTIAVPALRLAHAHRGRS
jgi:hypothetical protein